MGCGSSTAFSTSAAERYTCPITPVKVDAEDNVSMASFVTEKTEEILSLDESEQSEMAASNEGLPCFSRIAIDDLEEEKVERRSSGLFSPSTTEIPQSPTSRHADRTSTLQLPTMKSSLNTIPGAIPSVDELEASAIKTSSTTELTVKSPKTPATRAASFLNNRLPTTHESHPQLYYPPTLLKSFAWSKGEKISEMEDLIEGDDVDLETISSTSDGSVCAESGAARAAISGFAATLRARVLDAMHSSPDEEEEEGEDRPGQTTQPSFKCSFSIQQQVSLWSDATIPPRRRAKLL